MLTLSVLTAIGDIEFIIHWLPIIPALTPLLPIRIPIVDTIILPSAPLLVCTLIVSTAAVSLINLTNVAPNPPVSCT